MAAISLRALNAIFLRIGNTTFGGGDPMIIALRKELVENRGALTQDQFALSYMLARVTPGTNILAFSAGTGFQLRGWAGSLIAVAAVAIPSAVLAIVVSGAYQSWMANPFGAAAINATLAAAVGMMFGGVWLIVRPYTKGRAMFRALIVVAAAFALEWWAGWSPLQVMGVAAVAGILWREPSGR